MNDAVYGKTMEILKNRIDVKLVSNKKEKLITLLKIRITAKENTSSIRIQSISMAKTIR